MHACFHCAGCLRSLMCCALLTQPCPSLPLPPRTAARNPNAAAVLAAAAEQAAKREARLAANPKPPKGAPRKRKSGEVRWREAAGAGSWLGGRQVQGGWVRAIWFCHAACIIWPQPLSASSRHQNCLLQEVHTDKDNGPVVLTCIRRVHIDCIFKPLIPNYVQEGDTDEDEVGEGLWASGRQSRQRSRKHFGALRPCVCVCSCMQVPCV